MRMLRMRVASTALAIALVYATASYAADVRASRKPYHLPAEPLTKSLFEVSRISGRQILFPGGEMAALQSPPLEGEYTPEEAVDRILFGTGFRSEATKDAIFVRGRSVAADLRGAELPITDTEITVTGSRIRGAAVSSPVVRLEREDILRSGASTVAQAAQTIPQNFGGGQNPGVVGSPAGSNNTSSASSINLRGLGSSATLTLINGHRISYDAEAEAVDISVIPLLAVDRIEVVPDGSSAIYGSDAVAGVANIILRKDFRGVEASARVGLATDGGDRQQQYDLLAGHHWSSGNALVAYDFERDTAISGDQRSYAREDTPGLTLYPYIRHHNVLVSGHQDITDKLTFDFDGFFNKRWSHEDSAFDAQGNYLASGGRRSSTTSSFALAPSLRLQAARDWSVSLTGVYGQDHSRFTNDQYLQGAFQNEIGICYCNSFRSAELGATGSLVELPAGPARIAVGGGGRRNDFDEITNFGSPILATQSTYYAYGEINVPVIGADMRIPFARRLVLSGAVRYEDSPGIGRLATPRLGLILDVNRDLDIKASWGKAFRAPTLQQRFAATTQALFPAAYLGGSGYPANATALYLVGGNPDLKPERATTWSTTLELHPRMVPNASVQLSYFHVDFRNRIVAPILYTSQALSRPEYADLVDTDPTAQDLTAVDPGSLVNITGRPYNPRDIVAIVDNRNLNVASQVISGVDLSASYKVDLASGSSLRLEGDASYLKSRQRLSDLQPVTALAGTVFNPPHFRGRFGATWIAEFATVSTHVNYIGGVSDIRAAPALQVHSMTTWDMSAQIPIRSSSSALHGLSIQLTINNITNTKPGRDAHLTPFTEPVYDSTNYSPIGRFLSLTVRKRW